MPEHGNSSHVRAASWYKPGYDKNGGGTVGTVLGWASPDAPGGSVARKAFVHGLPADFVGRTPLQVEHRGAPISGAEEVL